MTTPTNLDERTIIIASLKAAVQKLEQGDYARANVLLVELLRNLERDSIKS